LSALPPKIDIQIEDAGNRQGKSTIIVTLTRESQAVRSSKQSYADMVHLLALFLSSNGA
jgi:ATP-dependent DNA helicase HFM1/MER3